MSDRIGPDALLQRLDQPGLRILDVRTWLEFRASHIPRATFLGLPRATAAPGGVDVGDAATVVLICLSGHRSRLPLAGLRAAHPHTTFVDLEGGMLAWWTAGHPTAR